MGRFSILPKDNWVPYLFPFDSNYKWNVDNYGITYGPDPANPRRCILDTDLAYYNSAVDFGCQAGKQCGRFPNKHGSSQDGGMYYSSFVAAMWYEHLLPKQPTN